MVKIGVKIWSTNISLFPSIVDNFEDNKFDFLEITAIPGSFNKNSLSMLKGIPTNIHTPNEDKLNLMEKNPINTQIMEEVFKYADFFNSDYIIIHAGIGNKKENFLKNIAGFKDNRLTLENTPFKSLIGETPLYAHSYRRIRELIELTGLKFCLDINHAVKSAKTQSLDYKNFLLKLKNIGPIVFHLSDGNSKKEEDEHLNIGEGNIDFQFIKKNIIDKESLVVFETPKKGIGLENDIKNIKLYNQL